MLSDFGVLGVIRRKVALGARSVHSGATRCKRRRRLGLGVESKSYRSRSPSVSSDASSWCV